MSLLLFVLACGVALAFLLTLIVGTWHVVHVLRRRYRLEREADDRENRRRVAADFAEAQKQLVEGGSLNFSDYLLEPSRKTKAERYKETVGSGSS